MKWCFKLCATQSPAAADLVPFPCKQQQALQGQKALGFPMGARTSVLFPAQGTSRYVKPLLPSEAACSSLKNTCPLCVNPCPSVCRALSALLYPRLPCVPHAQLVVPSDDVQVERPWLFQVLLTMFRRVKCSDFQNSSAEMSNKQQKTSTSTGGTPWCRVYQGWTSGCTVSLCSIHFTISAGNWGTACEEEQG